MKRRTAGVMLGILTVVCVGLVLSAVYPFTTSDPHAAKPPSERFTVGNASGYSASGSIIVGGEVRLAFEGVLTPDGAWYQRVVDEGVISEGYRPSANGTVYHRLTIEGAEAAEERREQIIADEDQALVREDLDGDGGTFVIEQNATGVADPIQGTASVFVNSLFVAGYEAEGTDPSAVTVYEPQSGWYDGRETYRITGASGAVHVDADTHELISANVSWEVTVPAGTYARYVLVRLTSDEPTTFRIEFEFDPDDQDLERPTWVAEPDSE